PDWFLVAGRILNLISPWRNPQLACLYLIKPESFDEKKDRSLKRSRLIKDGFFLEPTSRVM
ncbi:MAG: hypothetical protein AAFR77_20030, partial [Cyanobacteria bacterium J06631_2]